MNSKQKKIMIMTLGIMAFFANGDNYAVAPLLINIANDLNLSISTAAAS
jgi:predicted MFS family arabinose efflux permease